MKNSTRKYLPFENAVYELTRPNHPDLTVRQLAVLLRVYGTANVLSVKHLAEHFGFAKPAVTRALDKLAECGYIVREPDLDDKRMVQIKRTCAGYVFLGRIQPSVMRRVAA